MYIESCRRAQYNYEKTGGYGVKVERIEALPLTKGQALQYAGIVIKEKTGEQPTALEYLGGGSFGRAVTATIKGKRIVVKFLRAKDMMAKEAHDLSLLSANCDIKIPAVMFTREADKTIPVDCYGMEMIEGKSALFALGMLFMSKKRRLEFADKITSALHRIHSVTSDKFGDTLDPDCDDWLDYYRPFAAEVLRKAEEYHKKGQISDKIITAMRAAWKKFDVIFSEKVKTACLIHGDLNVGNIMVGKGYEITGIIDPLNSMYADREYDLFQFDNLTGKRFFLRETYIRKYGASRYCMQKLAFYGLWNEVYCYIKSGVLVGLIMDPLVKNMHKRLAEL